MRFLVAVLAFLTVFGSAAVAQGQPQRQNKSAVNKPPSETLRICQGVAIPDGYVIVAYMTSSACAHGAYILKKQAAYEDSLAVNGAARQGAEESSASPNDKAKSTGPQSSRTSRATSKRTSASGNAQPQRAQNSAAPVQVASSSRPRRVGGSEPGVTQSNLTQPDNSTANSEPAAGPPTLIGGQPQRPLGPPKLVNAGTSPVTSSNEPKDPAAVAAPTPEEVDEGDVVRVETSLVTVPVSVLDKNGRFVANLVKDDFRVFENGVEQPIAYFEPAEKPFTVALVLDTSASTHFHLDDIKQAAIAFAKQLRPQDRVLVVSFSDEVLLLTEATNDVNMVETIIEENVYTGSSTRLYDAVDLTIRERLNRIKGRKAIVLFTDGVDTSSQLATYHDTLREAEELDALIYPIQYNTDDYRQAMQNAGGGTITITTRTGGIFGGTSTQTYNVPGAGASLPGTSKADYDRADRYLHALADKTGGRLYKANDTKQLGDAFTRIAEELRRQYSLGYYPKNEGAEPSDRREIKVRVRQPNLAVKARDSYLKSPARGPNYE
jgi:VWFA-related protein